MSFQPDLRLLVASDGGNAAGPVHGAVSQLSAVCDVDLTVVHVATGGTSPEPRPFAFDPAATPRRLQRLELRGPDAAAAIASLCDARSFDLVLAPASAGSGPLRALRSSFRARLLARTGLPVWTAGPGLPPLHFHRPMRTVACLLDFDRDPEPLLQRAAAFARRMDARLHVLSVLPQVDDGTLAMVLTSQTPLLPAAARARIAGMCAGRPAPVVDVVVDSLRRGVARLLRAGPPDVLFVRASQWARPWPFGFPRALDRLGCPVICVPDADQSAWSFERLVPAMRHADAAAEATAVAAGALGPWPVDSVVPGIR